MVKYGWKNHQFDILEECCEHNLNNREEYYIKYYNTFNTEHGLNLTSGGGVVKLSKETKQKISNSLKNRIISSSTKQKIGCARKGTKLSKATKEKIGNSKRGNKYSVGRILKNATKNKIKGSRTTKKFTM